MMKLRLLILTTLLTMTLMGVVPVLSVGAEAKPGSAQNSATTRNRLQRYVQPNQYSIDYPSGWSVSAGERVLITNYPVPKRGSLPASVRRTAIKTDVFLQPGSFESVAKQTIAEASGNTRLLKRSRVTIGDREALRVWTAERGFEFPNAIITVIPYRDNETATVVSFYDDRNSAAIKLIETIHSTFRAETRRS